MPLAALAIILAIAARGPQVAQVPFLALDTSLFAAALVIAAQLIPLTPELRLRLAPSSIAFEQAVRVGPATAPILSGPISVDPAATRSALFAVALILLVFWSARTVLTRGGGRTTIRGIAIMGLIVAPLAIAQHITAPKLFYWLWAGSSGNTLPYSPFVNRNDFAGWLVMAIPLTVAYAVGRIQSHSSAGEPFDPDVAFDNHGLLLTVAAFTMTAALLASLSRSGMAGAAAGLAVFLLLSRRRLGGRRAAWMIGGVVVMVAAAAMYTNMDLLARRMSGVMSEGVLGRLSIWRQSWPVVSDFWPVGAGVGSYQRVMMVYQTSSRLFYISHADNELLQMLAEGGALLAVPVTAAIVSGIALVRRRLRTDRTRIFWIRAGAASSLVAIAVQNMWEMTLRVPANAVLLAICAALAVREAAER